MFTKTYKAETVLRKKKKTPFPKEVLQEVQNNEDLFTAFFARNIKEVKQKVKTKEPKKNKVKDNKKVSKNPVFDVIHEQIESNDSDILLDSFDALSKGPSCGAQVNHAVSTSVSESSKRSGNDKKKSNVSSQKNDSVFEINEEKLISPAETKKKIKKKRFFEAKLEEPSLHLKENKKRSAKEKKTYKPNLNDSLINLIEDFDSDALLTDFYARCNRHQGSKESLKSNDGDGAYIQEESSPKSLSQRSSDKLNDLKFDRDLFVSKRRKKSALKLTASTPASKVSCEVPCELSPIFSYQFMKIRRGNEKLTRDKDSTESELDITVAQFKKINLEENQSIFGTDGQNSGVKEAESSDIADVSCRLLLQSPDPFADSFADPERASVPNEKCGNISEAKRDASVHGKSQTIDKHSVIVLDSSSDPKESSSSFSSVSADVCSLTKKSVYSRQKQWDRGRTSSEACRQSFFAPRKSHVVVPLAQFESSKRSSAFRELYCNSSLQHPVTNYVSEENITTEDMEKERLTFKDVVLEHCSQLEILPFDETFPDCDLENCKKIGEGVYGEVFSREKFGSLTVMKIMPIEGSCAINGETQKTFEEILPEIVITKELSNLRMDENFSTSNYPELIGCRCVQGVYPSRLLSLWHQFDEEKTSENDCPDILPDDQIFIILELSNVGIALEAFTFRSAVQCLSVFKQITYTLAVAEAALEFEHRDLHWGNILIKETKNKTLNCKIYGTDVVMSTHGIQASVIDFTLSRITYDGCCIYNDLAEDHELFEGEGDYQFDIYRQMREQTENNWQAFQPYTSVLWLSYVLEKLITEVYYHNKCSKIHKKAMSKLRQLRTKILDFKCTVDVALSLDF